MFPAAAPPAAPDSVTSGHGTPHETTRRRTRGWGAVTALGCVVAVLAVLAGVVVNHNQDTELSAQNHQIEQQQDQSSQLSGVVEQQNSIIGQVCALAGGKIGHGSSAAEACQRVAAGQPAVPTPAPPPVVVTGAAGLGIDHVEQDGQCYVNVILTNRSTSRFGPFCGAAGAAGASGQPGATGPSGLPGASGADGPSGVPGANGADGANGQSGVDGRDGAAGVGIADVTDSADRCDVTVSLTDGSTRTIGPFCGSPAQRITLTLSDGTVQDCARTGGDDSSPAYSCAASPPEAPPTPS